ncbi:hypothetical protein TURBIDO_80 [Mycobacterium phage Turbido]|uniref:Uncharacterized protein n=8 Tax=Turbidovirus TaxID=2948936 RepID=A0A1D8EZT2_9CAUD|nr:hypothetical protein TURBIDO_80 [Mycobacterium phage Turbido]YP_010063612.1 hypothetical protein KIY81_gp13 [Mycobacterium phage Bugsy]AOT27737.1 hypothetical protein SEA_JERM_81 [Mycobacterium phage Jerm]AWH13597.1 hypothetical protein SEA_ABBYPAIGE_81 [Mycobacterium phage AbbyPaige]AYD86629.1 hypothetical protein SEA_LILTURB_80 [Mycobacterium phage LilTurb]QBI96581.1 hypothetical protein SEA_WHABIGAIL7_79 [Mycobacterium phage Whabigail7]QUE25756.1 hypothetical protein SEA_SMEAGAN_82 [Myc
MSKTLNEKCVDQAQAIREVKPERIGVSPKLAMEQFKEIWGDGYLIGDIGTKLTCMEMEALADMLQACGVEPSRVEEFISYHAEGDECGDMHCTCDDPECIEERNNL